MKLQTLESRVPAPSGREWKPERAKKGNTGVSLMSGTGG